jgi:hypothetical protein
LNGCRRCNNNTCKIIYHTCLLMHVRMYVHGRLASASSIYRSGVSHEKKRTKYSQGQPAGRACQIEALPGSLLRRKCRQVILGCIRLSTSSCKTPRPNLAILFLLNLPCVLKFVLLALLHVLVCQVKHDLYRQEEWSRHRHGAITCSYIPWLTNFLKNG